MRRVCLAVAAAVTCGAFAPAATADELTDALDAAGGGDVVVYDLPAKPGAARVRAATRVRAPAAAVTAVLMDAARFEVLLPSLAHHEEIGRRGDARVIEWELEIPLFNLEGTLELRPRPNGVELALVDGDLSPGSLVFTATPRDDGGTTLTVDARVDVRRSSFFLRKIMARSPWGEPAAASAAVLAALRATALRAEHAREAATFRPRAALTAPTPGAPDGKAVLSPPVARLAARGAVAVVTSTPSGRLAGVSVGVPERERRAALAARLADPRSWRAFPGRGDVRFVPQKDGSGGAPTIVVEDSIPFVELDATWRALPDRARAWSAIAGAAQGAWFGWQVGEREDAPPVVVLTAQPRLDRTGSIPRRFIEAEPLLEHGLALALTFVDALSATQPGASR
jgi:hypothetical protein